MQFTDEERGIFTFHDGLKERKGDPLAIWDVMEGLLGMNPEKAREKMLSETGLPGLESRRKFWEAVSQAFELAPFDPETGAGATQAIKLAAWNALAECLQKKSQKPGLWPTCSPSTA